MTHGKVRPAGNGNTASRQRSPFPPTLKANRRRDGRLQTPSIDSPTLVTDVCLKKGEFAPTENRFSILAELERQPNESKRAFDFAQATNNGFRRHGKRGGKHTKPQATRKRDEEAAKRDGDNGHFNNADDFCKQMTVPRTGSAESVDNFSGPLSRPQQLGQHDKLKPLVEEVRHHWMPQYRSSTLPTQSTTVPVPAERATDIQPGFLQPPNRGFDRNREKPSPPNDPTQLRSQKSRFFPLAAFPTTPETDARQPKGSSQQRLVPTASGTEPRRRVSIMFPTASHQEGPIAIPTAAQKAIATAACCALATRKSITTPVAITMGAHSSRSASPSPLAIATAPTGVGLTRPSTSSLRLPLTPLSAPIPITPCLTASPILEMSPAVSTMPSLPSSPTGISTPRIPPCSSDRSLPPLDSRTQGSPIECSSLTDWSSLSWPASPISVRASSESLSPSPRCKSFRTSSSTRPFPRKIRSRLKVNAPIASAPYFAKGCAPAAPILTQPTACPPTVPLPISTSQEGQVSISALAQPGLTNFLQMGHANPCWCMSHKPSMRSPSAQSQPPETEWTDLRDKIAMLRKHNRLDSDIESVLCTPSSSGSGFEDLGGGLLQDQSDSEEGETEVDDDDWMLVLSGGGYERLSSLSTSTTITSNESSITLSEAEELSSVDQCLYPSPPPTPPIIPETLVVSATAEAAASPPARIVTETPTTKTPNIASNTWPTPLPVTVPISVRYSSKSPPPSPRSERDPQVCTQCASCECMCTTATTSSLKWLTVQEAMSQRRKRSMGNKRSAGSERERKAKMWDGVVDWFV